MRLNLTLRLLQSSYKDAQSKQRSLRSKYAIRAVAAMLVISLFSAVFLPQPDVVKGAVDRVKTSVGCSAAAAAQYTGIHKDLTVTSPAQGLTVYGGKDGQKPSRIIKLTFAYGKGSIDPAGQKQGMDDVREGVIAGHIEHARRHGYRQYVQRSNIMQDIRTKPTTALQIILEELQKPEGERAEWIVQHDADMVVYNFDFPLETFIPPQDRDDIHLMGTWDGNGFNSGCLYMRVSPHMARMLGGNIMYDVMPGNRPWKYAEQGQLANLIYDVPSFNASTVIMPKHWVNAYPPGWEGGFKPGDWILHTVAWSKAQLPEYVKEASEHKPENNISPEQSGIAQEVTEFWAKLPRKTA
jgi:hypothetical protein